MRHWFIQRPDRTGKTTTCALLLPHVDDAHETRLVPAGNPQTFVLCSFQPTAPQRLRQWVSEFGPMVDGFAPRRATCFRLDDIRVNGNGTCADFDITYLAPR